MKESENKPSAYERFFGNAPVEGASKPQIASDDSVSWPGPLFDLACAVAAQKWVVAVIVSVGLLGGGIRLMFLPSVYKSSAVAVLMSREKPTIDAAIDTSSIETSNDSAGKSAAGNLMLPPNPTLYTTLIKSRAVMSKIADSYSAELAIYLSPRDRSDEVINILKSMVQVTSTEDGLITITVSTENPVLSANLANELFEECKLASQSIERQLVLQQAGHLDQALQNASERLNLTESRLKAFTATYSLIDLDLQAGNKLRSLREFTFEKAKLNSELEEMLLNYSEKSPEVQRLRIRIKSIEKQSLLSQNNIVGAVGMEDFGGLIVAHESLMQQVRFERDLVSTLATKADIYRIRAEQPAGNLAIIREAIEPNRPAGPSKKLELGITLGLSIFLALGWSLMCQQWERASRDSYVSSRMADLKEQLKSPLLVELYVKFKNRKSVLEVPEQ